MRFGHRLPVLRLRRSRDLLTAARSCVAGNTGLSDGFAVDLFEVRLDLRIGLPVALVDGDQHLVDDGLVGQQVLALAEFLLDADLVAVGDVGFIHFLPLGAVDRFRHGDLPAPQVFSHLRTCFAETAFASQGRSRSDRARRPSEKE